MRLESADGRFVGVEVVRYQFEGGHSSENGPDWDANWLVVAGQVWDGARRWAFSDPCLTTWEAVDLASWLRGTLSAHPPSDTAPDDLTLKFTEPVLAFRLCGMASDVISLEVSFQLEWPRPDNESKEDDDTGRRHRVPLEMPRVSMEKAVEEWNRDLRGFPPK